MANESHTARRAFGDIAPAPADCTDQVSFGEVWEHSGLSPRDRSLDTVASTALAIARRVFEETGVKL